jgi:hypothetical protein
MMGTISLLPGAAVQPRYSLSGTNAHGVRPLLYFQVFVFPGRKFFLPRPVVRGRPWAGIPSMTRDTETRWRAERRAGPEAKIVGGSSIRRSAPQRGGNKAWRLNGASGDSNDCMAVSSGGYSASDFTKLTRPGSQRRGTRLGKEVSYEVTLVVTPHVKMR